ncbi:glycerate 2-kinase [Paragonimus westermani]|uniref:Glycerate 2-kinase n=1 Tax=Paragonimus westermani TaxID=34504 RepID=A0A5J4NPK2_9TREM|nr:glycerate 2-kinase [Paragonimus westermani]
MPVVDEICYHAFDLGVRAVDAYTLVTKSVRFHDSKIEIQNTVYNVTGRLVVFGIGKAALGMLRAIFNVPGVRIDSAIGCVPQPTENELSDEGFCSGSSRALLGIGEDSLRHNSRIRLFYGPRTNLPNEEVVQASVLMSQTAISLGVNDLLLVCLTGGGSALLTLPKGFRGGRLPLTDVLTTIKLVSSAGADISELNAVRSCLDELKAGGLASLAYPAQVVCLIISDVIGDPIQYIASGPTYINPQFPASLRTNRCLEVLQQYDLLNELPQNIQAFLTKEQSTPSVDDTRTHRVHNWIIGNNSVALNTASSIFGSPKPQDVNLSVMDADATNAYYPIDRILRYTRSIFPVVLTNTLHGDASGKGRIFAELLWCTASYLVSTRIKDCKEVTSMERKMADLVAGLIDDTNNIDPIREACLKAVSNGKNECGSSETIGICLLLGGEATVTVPSFGLETTPLGGRCSHFALAAAVRWYELKQNEHEYATQKFHKIGLLAGASDGLDGPTACGGGVWVSAFPQPTINSPGLYRSALQCLEHCNSYGFFKECDADVILPAKLTNTNVMDLMIGVAVVNR